MQPVTKAQGPHVLLIEDDLDLLEAMSHAFGSAGHPVSEAADADEGLWLLGRGLFGLVVTGMILPGVDGLEVIAAVKQSSPATKVIATAPAHPSGRDPYLMVARYFGADATLAKPFEPQALLDLAARVLSGT